MKAKLVALRPTTENKIKSHATQGKLWNDRNYLSIIIPIHSVQKLD